MERLGYQSLLFVLLLLAVGGARAEFTLNFLPKGSGSFITTHDNSDNGSDPDTGQTSYLDGASWQRPEIVTDPDNGNTYYHMIIGDIADGFIQETFIQMGYGGSAPYDVVADGGPFEIADSASASGGLSPYNSIDTFGNGYDPMDMNKDAAAQAVTSGNGSANPTRVIMRQVQSDGEVMMEFLKDKYDYKARISMTLIAPDITAFFDFDMRNSTFDDALTPGVMVNTYNLWGEGVPNESASFDHATQSQNPYVTGGMYTYTEGTDITNLDADGKDYGGSNGSYSYTDGADYDQEAIPWADYMDPMEANPWSFESSKVP